VPGLVCKNVRDVHLKVQQGRVYTCIALKQEDRCVDQYTCIALKQEDRRIDACISYVVCSHLLERTVCTIFSIYFVQVSVYVIHVIVVN